MASTNRVATSCPKRRQITKSWSVLTASNRNQLENVQWISIPVKISDPISVTCGGATWRVMFEKIIGLLISVPPLARWSDCPHPGMPIADTVAKDDLEADSWKTVHPSAKVTQEG